MAVKRKGNSNTKENLTWKLNVLAAKVGEDTHIEQAKKAALGKKHQGEPLPDDSIDHEKLVMELNEVKKRKLEAKLFHVRKEIKAGLKKSKNMEIQKQVKKLREAQSSVTSTPPPPPPPPAQEESMEATTDKEEKVVKKGKVYTAQDGERFEKELDIIKNIDIEPLVEKVLNNMIRKNATLKKDALLASVLASDSTPTSEVPAASINDDHKTLISNVEARLLGNKALTEPLKKSSLEIEMLLLAPEQRKAKRKVAMPEQQKPNKRPNTTNKPSTSLSASSSSLFMESLGGDTQQDDAGTKNKGKSTIATKETSSTDWEDPDFEKYYNGGAAPEKQNRPGQKQRRMKWEAIHGNKAKHIVEGKESVNEKRMKKKQSKQRQTHPPTDKKQPFINKREGSGNKKKVEENIEEFHPSWQAKRQQQEMMAKAFSGKGGGNKKIVFEDAE